MLSVGSLFTGVGGFDLGLERAGMRVLWQCESDPFCRRVLAEHWPELPCYPDVSELRGADVAPVDLLCGGFPCQDLSVAGKGAGIDGARSGLWAEFARLIGELSPRYVIVENVSALLARGMGRVLGDLAALGYDAEWDCLPASAFGAPHQRDRVWLVGYASGGGFLGASAHDREHATAWRRNVAITPRLTGETDRGSAILADAASEGWQPRGAAGEALSRPKALERFGRRGSSVGGDWLTEPDVGRVAHGIPARVDRLRSLGNALVPQIAEWIGWRIVSYEQERG